ncbi:Aldo/keto reductase [Dichomitus squalens LYAD-421 SS1]|uniref:Aldo/keto reductase n=1 Tax=Dichomitus squalens (strain LYAD-421) TaxID=732165 RepID=R7SJ77_DICSQ|nr:Aldo/keto reductase [Dichomitus squalens LYAD-421 SS1]EJF56196.1 Aldo/keto reductase [Dichomitus squalens LYAD-421 SS1]
MTSPATRKLGNADALDAVLENGYIHIDTADAYNDNERLIGKWLQKSGRRKDIFLATQFGFAIDGKPFPDRRIQLGTDYVDLWYLNRTDPMVPIEISVKDPGRPWGSASSPLFPRAGKAPPRHAPIAALQIEYSPFALDIEDEKYGAILKTARELGVKIVAYSPVGRGILAGKYVRPTISLHDEDPARDDTRRYLPRFSAENSPKVLQAVDVIKGIAAKHGVTTGQVTLAWLLAQGDDILNMKENTMIGAVDVKLTAEEVDLIRKAAALLMVDTPFLE